MKSAKNHIIQYDLERYNVKASRYRIPEHDASDKYADCKMQNPR